MSRILAVPLIFWLLASPGKIRCLLAMIVFILASLTDTVDGMVARRMNQVSNFGKFLDPLADKILIGSVLIMLTALGWVQDWIVILIIAREFLVTGLRGMAVEQGIVLAADKFGKIKTILQTVALCPLILHHPWFGLNPVPPGMWVLYAALAMTVFSGGNYLYNFYSNWLQRESSA